MHELTYLMTYTKKSYSWNEYVTKNNYDWMRRISKVLVKDIKPILLSKHILLSLDTLYRGANIINDKNDWSFLCREFLGLHTHRLIRACTLHFFRIFMLAVLVASFKFLSHNIVRMETEANIRNRFFFFNASWIQDVGEDGSKQITFLLLFSNV